MNLYPDQLRGIVIYLEALDAAEKAVQELNTEYVPYPKSVPLTDSDGGSWGVLRDEIGGSWSWSPVG